MSKPAHRGRILVSSRLPDIENVGNISAQRTAQPPVKAQAVNIRRGSGSKSADLNGSIMAAGTSALGGLSKDKLQRRVGELEYENQKLKNSLEKAELSIESYRGFLSAKSATRSHSICVQTDFVAEGTQSTTKNTPNKKSQITKLTNKLEDARSKISLLNQQIVEFEERERASNKENNSLREDYNTLKMTSDLAEVSYKAQIQTLEKDLRALQSTSQADQQSPTVRTPTAQSTKHFRQQQQQLKTPIHQADSTPPISSKKLVGANKMTPVSSASKLELKPQTPPSSIDRLVSRPSAEILISPIPVMKKSKLSSATKKPLQAHSADKAKHHKLPLKELKKKIVSHKSHFSTIKSAIAQDFDNFKHFFSLQSHKIIGQIQKVEDVRDTRVNELLLALTDLRLKLSESEEMRLKEKDNVDNKSSSHAKQLAELQADLQKELRELREEVETERNRADSLEMTMGAKLNEKDADISNLTALFNSASRELKNLQVKFKAETAAVKHLGHCKDLVRVATIRELNLDKDRAYSELKFARDIQCVIGFCLETAEKALNETQPQVVERLHDSRRKRTTLLEREVMVRRKDLDQRSAETCAVSSTHLEAFQEKSVIKHKKAAEETETLFNEIQNILSIKNRA
mmetsp:Transcript_23275/g.39445  ORF Transcript_23275/g.39445 Transcript_23275/m.39445 type:complete len:631 (-) Transcript_23275:128-2020(-)